MHCRMIICVYFSVSIGQETLSLSLAPQETDDIFFDMSWLEEEEDWLSLKQEVTSISENMTHSESFFQESRSLPQVISPLNISVIK